MSLSSFVLALATAATSGDAFAPLDVYAGDWNVTLAPPGGTPKTDRLTNRCTPSDLYFTCEQIVDGTTVALVVYVRGDGPRSFRSNVVFPNGRTSGRSDVTIAGDVITYLTTDDAGKPTGRVLNTLRDRDHIHIEIDRPGENGTWIATLAGDEERAKR